MSSPPNRAKSLFLSAMEIVDVDARNLFLAAECGNDRELQEEVEQLLRHHKAESAFLKLPNPQQPDTSDFAPSKEPKPGEQSGLILVNRYKLIEPIGEGGMGRVWTAMQTVPVRRKVAIKLIKAGMDTQAVLKRFEAERQTLALMDHPNIARVFDAGETVDVRPFFVMELVNGVPITQFCDEHRLSIRERLALFMPVCQAIQHAHQKGIIHRDIKPSNVLVAMVEETPVPKVIDFGVAKAAGPQLIERTLATGFGTVIGTPEYMSPEQASFNNLDIDTRSDVYSLGVLLYELLAGAPPFCGAEFKQAGFLELLRAVRETDPLRPSIRLATADTLAALAASRRAEPARLATLLRGELDWIVMKSLEKDRTRRYETANALARDVQRFLADELVEARPPSRGYRLRRLVRKNRTTLLAATLFTLFLLGAVIGSTWLALLAQKERNRVVATQKALQINLTRQMADRIQADMLRLSAVGDALKATVELGDNWDEKRFVRWMTRALEAEPDILGLSMAFEPETFHPLLDPATSREPPNRLAAQDVHRLDPDRDGYSLYVHHRLSGPNRAIVVESLKPSYHYRKQPWYLNTFLGRNRGWEEPSYDTYGESIQMVAYTAPLKQLNSKHTIGVLCLDVALTYYQQLESWLKDPNFGKGSYGFVVSANGKIITHPHVQANSPPEASKLFPDIREHSRKVWADPAFAELTQEMLTQAGEEVGRTRGIDPATGRRSSFLYTRIKPANWIFVAVIPEDEG